MNIAGDLLLSVEFVIDTDVTSGDFCFSTQMVTNISVFFFWQIFVYSGLIFVYSASDLYSSAELVTEISAFRWGLIF